MTVDSGVAADQIWQVVAPTGTTDTNYVTNPSFETNTTGWTATSATLTRVVGAGRYGGYGGRLLASALNGRAEYSGPQNAGGTPVAVAAYVKADSASVVLRVAYGGVIVDVTHPGDGQAHRLEIRTVAVAATTPVIGIRDGRSGGWTNVDIDGVTFESGVLAATTYIDGDQDGCRWTGTPHGSTSQRDGRDGNGGAIKTFDSLGLDVVSQKGLGRAPTNVSTQPQAFRDGSIYQGTVKQERVFTLTCEILYASGLLRDLHTNRRVASTPFELDTRSNRGPVMLRYTGGGDVALPRIVRAYNESGWGMDDVETTTEVLPLRFLAPDSDFEADYDVAAGLTPSQNVTSVSYISIRTPDGTWLNAAGGSSGAALTSFVGAALRLPDGRILVGGRFDNMGGVAAADGIALWNGTSWAATVGTVTPPGYVNGLALTSAGDVVVVGNFATLGGAGGANNVALYHPSTNTVTVIGSTGADTVVWSSVVDTAGNIWIVGQFSTIGGISAAGLAYYNLASGTWTAATSGWALTLGVANKLAIGPDNQPYVTGTTGVFRQSGGSWVSIGATNASNTLAGIASFGGYLYAYGTFTSIGGVAANRIARYNGSTWQPLGSGMAAGGVYWVVQDPTNGNVIASGNNWGTVGGIQPPDSIAIWTGSAWLPFSANPPNTATHANDFYGVSVTDDGTLVLSWQDPIAGAAFGTTLNAESVTTVTNAGSANAYPVVKLVITASCSLYSLVNLTTGQALRFNGTLLAGETVTIDLRPNQKTVRSSFRELIGLLLSASALSDWALAPGANRIALYCSDASATAYLYWRNRYETGD